MLELRQYQKDAIQAVYDYYKSGETGNVIIDAATGAGKSVIIAKLMQDICSLPDRRVLQLSHVKELIAQNHSKLIHLWPDAPVGIYSASLKQKKVGTQITIAGIQSCYDKGNVLGFYHVVIIDETHLLGEKEDGMYRTLLNKLREINPKLRVIGLSATPWRTKGGLLTEVKNALFHKIVYSIGIKELVDMGYLCPLIGKRSKSQADLSGVSTQMGEFNLGEMEHVMDNDVLTNAALEEVFTIGADRKTILFFCSGVHHAKHVMQHIINRGITSAYITGNTPSEERDNTLKLFNNGSLRTVTNNAVLTTGTDIPRIDLIVLLRGTKSPGLMLQMCGRGMRLSPETGKVDCMILDYAGNLERFGYIDQIGAPSLRKKKNAEAPCKFCPVCESLVAINTTECPDCGFLFPQDDTYKHDKVADNAAVMSSQMGDWFDIDDVQYHRHPGKKITQDDGTVTVNPETLKVTYVSGSRIFREWVCINHTGFARTKALKWLEERIDWLPDGTCDEYIIHINKLTIQKIIDSPQILIKPTKIKVRKNGKYEEINGYEF